MYTESKEQMMREIRRLKIQLHRLNKDIESLHKRNEKLLCIAKAHRDSHHEYKSKYLILDEGISGALDIIINGAKV